MKLWYIFLFWTFFNVGYVSGLVFSVERYGHDPIFFHKQVFLCVSMQCKEQCKTQRVWNIFGNGARNWQSYWRCLRSPLYLDPPPPVYRYLGYLLDPPFIKTPSPLLFGTGECSKTLRKSKLKRYPIKRSGITVFDIYYWVNFKKRFGKFCQGNTLPITAIEY